ncbi:MAG: hypothetical protein PHV97_08235, partial [Candidatus Omnitrophica bacterium]|nr:hypothetical protein [Candidatus Omnitrophota bacterium]
MKKKRLGKNLLKDQRGFALISVYLVSTVVLIIALAAFGSVLTESRLLDREITRTQAYAAAEAGLQTAMAQIGQAATAYTGFIDTTRIPTTGGQSFQSATGATLGSFFVDIDYPDQLDWVTCTAQATVGNETRQLEGRIFLQSNLSKYLMYANTPSLALGSNLTMGVHDGINPQGVSANENDRAALYYTNNLDFSGSNIHIYGDTHAENFISGTSSNTIHGDTYVGGFAWDTQGRVTNDGINGTLTVSDGFTDDTDRNRDGTVNASDYTDRHDLLKLATSTTAEEEMKSFNTDARREEVIDTVDLAFYQTHNSSVVAQRNYGTTAGERYFVFEPNADATQTKVIVYGTLARFNADNRQYKIDEFTLPSGLPQPSGENGEKAILYNRGSVHVKG